ncbi:MAG: hypothetical protein ACLS36_05345 [Streptococcus sp.]
MDAWKYFMIVTEKGILSQDEWMRRCPITKDVEDAIHFAQRAQFQKKKLSTKTYLQTD